MSGDSTGDEPGLQSVEIAIGTPWRRNRSTGGTLRFPQAVIRRGKQHRDRSRAAHCFDIGFDGVFQMIRGKRAVARRELRAADVGQLLRVHLDRQAQARGRLEQALALRHGKRDVLAKHVDRVHQPLPGQRRQHVRANQFDIFLWTAAIFRRQRVRAEESRVDRDRQFAAEPARHAQHFRFGRRIQAVAGS